MVDTLYGRINSNSAGQPHVALPNLEESAIPASYSRSRRPRLILSPVISTQSFDQVSKMAWILTEAHASRRATVFYLFGYLGHESPSPLPPNPSPLRILRMQLPVMRFPYNSLDFWVTPMVALPSGRLCN